MKIKFNNIHRKYNLFNHTYTRRDPSACDVEFHYILKYLHCASGKKYAAELFVNGNEYILYECCTKK